MTRRLCVLVGLLALLRELQRPKRTVDAENALEAATKATGAVFASRQALVPQKFTDESKSHRLRSVVKHHEMSLFDDQVGKHRGLPARILIVRGYTFCNVQFFKQITLQVLGPVSCSDNVVPRHC